MQNSYGSLMMPFGANWFTGTAGIVIAILVVWSLIWKGIALWKSARAGSKVWFVVFLVVNTAGILEILYIYIFSKKSRSVSDATPEK